MVTFLKGCNDSNGQGRLMIFTILGMVTIIGMKANDNPRDGCHPWDCLENFDHLEEGNLPRDGDHPKNGDHHRGGDHHRNGGCLRDFYHPQGCLLKFGSLESLVSTKNHIKCESVCLSACL